MTKSIQVKSSIIRSSFLSSFLLSLSLLTLSLTTCDLPFASAFVSPTSPAAGTRHRRVVNAAFPLSPLSGNAVRVETTTKLNMSDKPEIEVISQPDKEFLDKKGVFSWGTWGCPPSKFPWTYDSTESCYLLEGKVTVTPSDGRQAVTFGKGDFVTFPAGMSCTWDVEVGVNKHFMFY